MFTSLNTKTVKMMQLCGTVAVILAANLATVEAASESGMSHPLWGVIFGIGTKKKTSKTNPAAQLPRILPSVWIEKGMKYVPESGRFSCVNRPNSFSFPNCCISCADPREEKWVHQSTTWTPGVEAIVKDSYSSPKIINSTPEIKAMVESRAGKRVKVVFEMGKLVHVEENESKNKYNIRKDQLEVVPEGPQPSEKWLCGGCDSWNTRTRKGIINLSEIRKTPDSDSDSAYADGEFC